MIKTLQTENIQNYYTQYLFTLDYIGTTQFQQAIFKTKICEFELTDVMPSIQNICQIYPIGQC